MKEKAGIGIADATVAQRNPSHSVICWRANLKVVDVSGRKISIEFARHLPESIKKSYRFYRSAIRPMDRLGKSRA